MIAPFLIQLDQALELRLEIIDRFVARFFCRRVERQVSGRFGRVGGLGSGCVAGFLFLLIEVIGGRFFQDRVLLQFLLDQSFKLQRWRLQKRQRLLQLRCKHQRLCESL